MLPVAWVVIAILNTDHAKDCAKLLSLYSLVLSLGEATHLSSVASDLGLQNKVENMIISTHVILTSMRAECVEGFTATVELLNVSDLHSVGSYGTFA